MAKAMALHCGTIVLAIANPLVRRAMTDEFRHRGVGEIVALGDFAALNEAAKSQAIDILVLDDVLAEIQTGPLIRDIRYGVVHIHPFPLVLALAHQQTELDLRILIDCGPDAIVLVPVSISDLFTKIERLALGRKPFIVTRNYIGPDRRTQLREGTQPPRFVDAPNPLAGPIEAGGFQDALQKCSEALKTAKMEASLDQLAFALKSGNAEAFRELIPAIDNLAKTTSKQSLKDAAHGLSAAISTQVFDEILQASKTLLTAATGKA